MTADITSQDELKVGDIAPVFSLNDQYNNPVSIESFRGNWLILYFYPKDDTPGCTKEAVGFSDSRDNFSKLGAVVIGVSPDSAKSHESFCNKYNLNLPLLSDPEHTVLERYGVWILKKMYGREYWGVERSTFLIDPEGVIQEVWRQVKVDGHVAEVEKKIKELRG
ncbi:MAG: thioredoxin-dependent thiol peroxidase [Candidatus Auribacterota bacterium]|jgi:peroxiredoxin Q/BCP|uniref:thioredoxin-dependent peroxiredoxin n=1 Tax=Candidatus Auribacter fodinae TaxID=2093366 RepID=A0A3A4R5W2_9BACT|nr:MAG: thioredoxin-dependent thiol peroxidase [Candidatus Auribacter fodinae]